jgi:2-keto-4-pentenoate hydratase/2-oxohepta-3-ene-1,7-dioic acid hydratase in catechol pathway
MARLLRLHTATGPRYARERPDGTRCFIEGDPLGAFRDTSEAAPADAPVLAPIAPPVVLCIGLNYRAHAQETGARIPEHPVLFMKSPAAVIGPGVPVEIPRQAASTKVDYECELAVVIARRCRNVSAAQALDYVAGYTCANDVSARDWQMEWGGGQFCRGKTFDTFCPLGPALVTREDIPDPNALAIRTVLNGETMQSSNTRDMIFDVRTLVSFLSASTTLPPGTLILTGTPSGVGVARQPQVFLRPGDEVSVEIEGIGSLTNPVTEERA